MVRTVPVEEAAARLRALLAAESAGQQDPLVAALHAFSDFALIDFSVPDCPDVDGCLFEYGINSLAGEPLFVVNLTRQFEVLDSSGEHESHAQVSCEVRYRVTSEAEPLGDCEEWWFRGEPGDFSSWWRSLPLESLVGALGNRAPTAVEVTSDII
ncbi:hypothetical protein [Streptomyces silaceus]|uniref:hypothetical protein n=1 Tax=Streptomyces silaceus TaxID=545123 RepID=UPI0006EBB266|nr:hypothetical protein [Streptomyces silaceus]